MWSGATASSVLTLGGSSASLAGSEVDLAIDAAGDGLSIDGAGDVVEVSPGLDAFVGTTAAITWPPTTLLDSESGQAFETEAGERMETET